MKKAIVAVILIFGACGFSSQSFAEWNKQSSVSATLVWGTYDSGVYFFPDGELRYTYNKDVHEDLYSGLDSIIVRSKVDSRYDYNNYISFQILGSTDVFVTQARHAYYDFRKLKNTKIELQKNYFVFTLKYDLKADLNGQEKIKYRPYTVGSNLFSFLGILAEKFNVPSKVLLDIARTLKAQEMVGESTIHAEILKRKATKADEKHTQLAKQLKQLEQQRFQAEEEVKARRKAEIEDRREAQIARDLQIAQEQKLFEEQEAQRLEEEESRQREEQRREEERQEDLRRSREAELSLSQLHINKPADEEPQSQGPEVAGPTINALNASVSSVMANSSSHAQEVNPVTYVCEDEVKSNRNDIRLAQLPVYLEDESSNKEVPEIIRVIREQGPYFESLFLTRNEIEITKAYTSGRLLLPYAMKTRILLLARGGYAYESVIVPHSPYNQASSFLAMTPRGYGYLSRMIKYSMASYSAEILKQQHVQLQSKIAYLQQVKELAVLKVEVAKARLSSLKAAPAEQDLAVRTLQEAQAKFEAMEVRVNQLKQASVSSEERLKEISEAARDQERTIAPQIENDLRQQEVDYQNSFHPCARDEQHCDQYPYCLHHGET